MKKHTLSLLFALALCLSIFAGCQSSELQAYSSDAPEVEAQEITVKDYTPVYESYAPDTVMLTVNGIDVTWAELFYWYYSDITALEDYFGEINDWDEATAFDPDQTYREYVTNDAVEITKLYRIIESKAQEMGVSLTEDEQATLEESWQANVTNYGEDEAAFIAYLEDVFMSKEMFFYMNGINTLVYAIQNEMYGESGEKIPEAEFVERAEEDGYMRAKHILLKTTDEENTPLSDEEKAEKLAAIEGLLAELLAIGDPAEREARMDELIAEYSEDTGSEYYIDGYTYTPGYMDEAFENATAELEDYQLSEVVESGFGYHIIMRLPLDPELAVTGSADSLGFTISQILFNEEAEKWTEECEVVFSKEYEELDIVALLDKVVITTVPAE